MELYHVLNRGVDKRIIFTNNADRARFVHNLYEFNDRRPAPDAYRRDMWDFVSPTSDRRERLVDIHGWCLMGNHYHLLLSERREGGLTLFLRKLNIGYSKYFNEIHHRDGTLFQGRTKKILIKSEPHFLHILHYIHLNPLDFLSGAEQWRTGKLGNANRAQAHLLGYRWSSLQDYAGHRNFPSILTTNLFKNVHGDVGKTTLTFLKDMDSDAIKEMALE